MYRRDLANVHHRAFGFHADACAPGILALLVPVLERHGTVLDAGALRPGGVLAIDLLDRGYGETRRDAPPYARVEDDWALVTRYESPAPDRFVRHITTFMAAGDGSWRRDDERHENVLVDTAGVPAALALHGVHARVAPSFGHERLPDGMVVITGRRI
jgi:hypothetical protein